MSYYKKAYNIEGYTTENGTILCPSCARDRFSVAVLSGEVKHEDNPYPIFAYSEWEYTPACDACDEPLDVAVLEDDESEYDFDYEEYIEASTDDFIDFYCYGQTVLEI